MTFAIGTLIAIAYQYRHRRRGRAIGLFLASFLVSWASQALWTHVPLFAGEPMLDHESWARSVRARPGAADAVSGGTLPLHKVDMGAQSAVLGLIELDGLPAGYSATPFTRDAELIFDDGSRLPMVLRRQGEREVKEGPRARWATLFKADEKTLQEHRDRRGTYTGTFDFVIERREPLTTMPVTLGAMANDGSRSVTVSELSSEPGGCDIRLTMTSVNLITDSFATPNLIIEYRLRDGRQLDSRFESHFAPPPQLFDGPFARLQNVLGSFAFERRPAYPVLPGAPSLTKPVPCDDIVMHVDRFSYVGYLTRTVTLHDFSLRDALVAP
jgi:hypothetical protein